MPSKKGSRSSGKVDAPQEAAAAPAPSGQGSLEPSEAASSTPSRDSPSALSSVIGHVLSSFSFLDPSPPADVPSNVGNLHQQESATSELSATSTSPLQHWSRVRTAALHLPATIQDSQNRQSTENEDLCVSRRTPALSKLKTLFAGLFFHPVDGRLATHGPSR
jgi:hypothetical protein